MGCCETMSGLVRGCERGIGGINSAWIACYDSVTKPTVTGGIITTIGTPASAWHEYEFRRQTGSITTTITTDDTNGSLYYSSDVILQFGLMESQKRTEIAAIAASDIAIIIEDANGHYWYFGYDNYVSITDGTIESGTASDDFNGYNITLNDISKQPPYEVTETAMAPILGEE